MEEKKLSAKLLKRRKFLLVLPLLVLPFVAIFFVALGGGKGKETASENPAGLNIKLPDAHFKMQKEKDKLGLYEEASKDSIKFKEAMKKDPFFRMERHDSALQHIFENASQKLDIHTNEEKLNEKIAQLKKAINKPSIKQQPNFFKPPVHFENNSATDPEIGQLNNMLDKIMLVQHPEKLVDSMKKLSEKNKQQNFAVSTKQNEISDSLFYGLDDALPENEKQNTIEAVISEAQTLVSGATIKLRLLNDVYVHGTKINKDAFVYGTVSMSNERLKITINSLRSDQNILPVSLEAYDMDGMSGIYIPGSISRDVGKDAAGAGISSLGIETLDPSLGAQAASAGIQAAKTLLTRKIKLVRVNIPAGYKIFLKDNNK